MIEGLCVFCGSSKGTDPAFLAAARAFGALLAREGIALVYGGGHVGLMGALAGGSGSTSRRGWRSGSETMRFSHRLDDRAGALHVTT